MRMTSPYTTCIPEVDYMDLGEAVRNEHEDQVRVGFCPQQESRFEALEA